MATNVTDDINAAAQPYLLEGGPVGVLLIHGFGGVPGELRAFGDVLNQLGYTVIGVLLARHGQGPEALRGVRWQEWYASVEAAWQELRSRCERVTVLGFSMGGLQALHLAAHRPLDGVITLAAALHIAGGWQLRALPVARYFIPWYYPFKAVDFSDPVIRANISEKLGPVDFDDPATLAQLRTSVRIATGAIYQVVRLGAQVRRELARIRVPALVLQGRLDEMVLPISAERIYAGLGSQDKELVWFERSGHQLPSDIEHREVLQTIVDWLTERLPATTEHMAAAATTGQQLRTSERQS